MSGRSEGTLRSLPPRGLLAGPMLDWFATISGRLDRPAEDLLRGAAQPLVAEYLDAWGGPAVPPDGRAAYVDRVAGALAFHWWRFGQSQFRPLDLVVPLVRSGRLAHGRVDEDVLREVVLAEGFCRRHPAATARFLAEYVPAITAAARGVGGSRAVEEFQGFEAELILPRGGKPAKLALYSGHTPLRAWLRQVVRNEWVTRARRLTPQAFGDELDRVRVAPTPDEVLQDHECLDVLRPLFEETVSVLEADEALLLRMVLLDQVPQQDVAKLWKVHKSTITRLRQRACRKLADRFRQRAEAQVRRGDAVGCLSWLLNASWEVRQFLGESLAGSLRRLEPPRGPDQADGPGGA